MTIFYDGGCCPKKFKFKKIFFRRLRSALELTIFSKIFFKIKNWLILKLKKTSLEGLKDLLSANIVYGIVFKIKKLKNWRNLI